MYSIKKIVAIVVALLLIVIVKTIIEIQLRGYCGNVGERALTWETWKGQGELNRPHYFIPHTYNSTTYPKHVNYTACTPINPNQYFSFSYNPTARTHHDFSCFVNDSLPLQLAFQHPSVLRLCNSEEEHCSCRIPATPINQFVTGINIEIDGFENSNMEYGGIWYYSKCTIEMEYSTNPLPEGQIFSQVVITNNVSNWWDVYGLAIMLFGSLAVMAIVAISMAGFSIYILGAILLDIIFGNSTDEKKNETTSNNIREELIIPSKSTPVSKRR